MTVHESNPELLLKNVRSLVCIDLAPKSVISNKRPTLIPKYVLPVS